MDLILKKTVLMLFVLKRELIQAQVSMIVLILILLHDFLPVHITHLRCQQNEIHLVISLLSVHVVMLLSLLEVVDSTDLKQDDFIPMILLTKHQPHGKEFFQFQQTIRNICI